MHSKAEFNAEIKDMNDLGEMLHKINNRLERTHEDLNHAIKVYTELTDTLKDAVEDLEDIHVSKVIKDVQEVIKLINARQKEIRILTGETLTVDKIK